MRCSNDSGIVLVVVLWLIVILSTLVFIIGSSAREEIAFAKYEVGSLRARSNAWSGILAAICQIDKEAAVSGAANNFSSENKTVVDLEELLTLEATFEDGYFQIVHPAVSVPGREYPVTSWYQSEAERINLNALSAGNYQIFQELLLVLGVADSVAANIARALVDWRDADQAVLEGQGLEDDYYASQAKPYRCKNRSLDTMEELMLVQGVTKDIYDRLLPYITIYPKTGDLRVDLVSAEEPVLLALARSAAGAKTNTDISDAESLVRKMITYRNEMRSDLKVSKSSKFDYNDLKLNTKERAIFFSLIPYRSMLLEVVRFHVRSIGRPGEVETSSDVVFDVRNKAILSWRNNGS